MVNDLSTLLVTKRFRVVEVDEQTTNGTAQRRAVVRHPGAVVILPMVDPDHVCLIRNYRIAVDEQLIELPAGTLEPGEDPQITAERELIEETGYRAGQLQLLHTFYMAPGILDERMRLFLATGLQAGESAREPGEHIENLIVPWKQAIDMVFAGTIRDAKTMVGLMLYDQLRRNAK